MRVSSTKEEFIELSDEPSKYNTSNDKTSGTLVRKVASIDIARSLTDYAISLYENVARPLSTSI